MTSPTELTAWRKSVRAEMLRTRQQLSPSTHLEKSQEVLQRLVALFKRRSAGMVGFYWPIKGEIDVLPLVELLIEKGWTAALPVVVAQKKALEFRVWRPRIPMTKGVYEIPHPQNGPAVLPGTVVVPLVGFDERCYRLGYGGGYYDRTLRASKKELFSIGIGFEMARLATIRPQAYDVPMDLIVTECGLSLRKN